MTLWSVATSSQSISKRKTLRNLTQKLVFCQDHLESAKLLRSALLVRNSAFTYSNLMQAMSEAKRKLRNCWRTFLKHRASRLHSILNDPNRREWMFSKAVFLMMLLRRHWYWWTKLTDVVQVIEAVFKLLPRSSKTLKYRSCVSAMTMELKNLRR